jgi:uncharacterized damage-inducible protein DinB
MLRTAIQELMTYNYALHRRLWQSIDHLTDEQFVQPVDYSIGSVRNHMVHVMSTDRRWLSRVQGEPLPERMNPDDFPTREITKDTWRTFETAMLLAVNEMDEDDMQREIDYTVRRNDGRIYQHRSMAWEMLAHIVNHGTEHRVQVLRLLYDLGAPTFEQDYMIYKWNE